MKRKLFSIGCCLVILLATILTSCQHEVPGPRPRPAVIGDVLLNDGTYVPYASITDEQKANAVAVVCGFNGNGKTLGLGLKQTKLAWASSSGTGYSTNFDKIVCTPSDTGSGAADNSDLKFTGDTDGSDNWNKICEKDTNAATTAATNYPAFNWVNNYGEKNVSSENYKTGWYMPSIAELTEIYRNKAEINKAITKLNEGNTEIASPLTDFWYWSSSQNGSTYKYEWFLLFSNGNLDSYYKDFSSNVRCVRAF